MFVSFEHDCCGAEVLLAHGRSRSLSDLSLTSARAALLAPRVFLLRCIVKKTAISGGEPGSARTEEYTTSRVDRGRCTELPLVY